MSKSKVIDGKTAVTELVQELDKTRRELAKATLALNQAETVNQQLKEDLYAKDRTLTQMQHEIVERDASHRLEVAAVAKGSDAHQQVSSQKSMFLENEVERLKRENEVLNEYMTQNQQLRQVLTQAHDALAELQRANAELRAQMATEIQSKTKSLEEDFTKRLFESEQKLREDAFNALSEESKVALAGNDKLQTVLQRQNETLDSVLQRCKDLEEAQRKIEEERMLIESDASGQQKEISRLHKVLEESNDRGTQLEDALKQRRIERASFELLFVEHNNVKEQLEKEKDKCRRAFREADRWREKAYTLADHLGADEKKDAMLKLQAIAQHSELLERNAERNKNRRDKLREIRKKNAEVVEAIASFERGTDVAEYNDDHDDHNDDDDEDDLENQNHSRDSRAVKFSTNQRYREEDEDLLFSTKRQGGGNQLQVSAMDILAIWNVNYQNEDAGYFPSKNNNSNSTQDFHQGVDFNINQRTALLSNSARGNKLPAQSPSSNHTQLPAIEKTTAKNNNNHGKNLIVDQDRAQRDLGLSVMSVPKLPNSHGARKLKEANAHQQQRASQAKSESLSLTGVKQKIPS